MKNALNWFEIPVTDFERAKKFYESVLACKLEEVVMGPMRMGFFPADESAVGGAIVQGEGYTPSADGTKVYLNADRILDEAIGRIEPSGGKVVMPKHLITEDIGHMALFIDSEGNLVALHAPMRK